MTLQGNPIMFKYINNEGNLIQFVINPEKSSDILRYNQFINGLFVGSIYTITEIRHLMDNGYKWKTTF